MKSTTLIAAVGLLGLSMAGGASACNYGDPHYPNCDQQCQGDTCIDPHIQGAYEWDFTSRGNDSTSGSWDYVSVPTGGPSVNVSAWVNNPSQGDSYGEGELTSTKLSSYDNSGLGAGYENSPEHAVDNEGKIDAILLAFDTPVTLNQVAFGWVGREDQNSPYDSDFTVLAYNGSDKDSLTTSEIKDNLDASSYANLTSIGWDLIGSDTGKGEGSYDGGPSPDTYTVDSGTTSSSFWLISALNTQLGGQNTYTTTERVCVDGVEFYGNCYGKNAHWENVEVEHTVYDYFKLCAVSATPSGGGGTPSGEIPEPSVVSLLLTGLLFAGYMRMRKGSSEAMILRA